MLRPISSTPPRQITRTLSSLSGGNGTDFSTRVFWPLTSRTARSLPIGEEAREEIRLSSKGRGRRKEENVRALPGLPSGLSPATPTLESAGNSGRTLRSKRADTIAGGRPAPLQFVVLTREEACGEFHL